MGECIGGFVLTVTKLLDNKQKLPVKICLHKSFDTYQENCLTETLESFQKKKVLFTSNKQVVIQVKGNFCVI